MSEWFYARGGIIFGPVDIEDLRHLIGCGRVSGSDFVRTGGMKEWAAADTAIDLQTIREEPSLTRVIRSNQAPAEAYSSRQAERGGDGAIAASWLLILMVCGFSMIPLLGFGSWVIAAPVLFVTFILSIVAMAQGRALHGIAILLITLVGAPIFIMLGPGIGLGIIAIASGHTAYDQVRSSPAKNQTPNKSSVAPSNQPSQTQPVPTSEPATVIFLCSAGGSMIDKMGLARAAMLEEIGRLGADQSFNVVYYRNDKVEKLFPRPVPTSPENKRFAHRLVTSISTGGTSTPVAGITEALAEKGEAIYLFTDGNGTETETFERFTKTKVYLFPASKFHVIHLCSNNDPDPEATAFSQKSEEALRRIALREGTYERKSGE